MEVSPLPGGPGFGGILTVRDPATFDAAALRREWLRCGGLLLVRGLVSAAEPQRLVELAEALGEVNRREQAAPAREDEGTAAWGEELRRTVQARAPVPRPARLPNPEADPLHPLAWRSRRGSTSTWRWMTRC